MLKTLRKLARKDDGASMVEYTVLLGLVLAVTIGLISTVGTNLSGVWTSVSTATSGLSSSSSSGGDSSGGDSSTGG